MSGFTDALHLAVGLFAIWFLYFVCWREHRIDAFRQHMFALRDDLFDFARAGRISFNDPAYTTLRNVANGLIRYGHQLNVSRVLAILIFAGLPKSNRMEEWKRDVESRPREIRGKLLGTHTEISKAVFWHVVPWSPLAWVCVLVMTPLALAANLFKVQVKFARHPQQISAVLEEDALDERAVDDECLVTG